GHMTKLFSKVKESIEGIKMPSTLTINGKAPIVAYAELIAARIVNALAPNSIAIKLVDDKKAPAAKLDDATEDVFNKITSKFAAIFDNGDKEQVAKWVNLAQKELVIKNFAKLSQSLETLDSQLNLRTFILGGLKYSAADVACWGALRSNGMCGSIIKNKVDVNVSRWYTLLEMDPIFGEAHDFLSKSLLELKKSANVGKKKETHKANFE
uniref:Glutamyl-tRNA synthetase, cytoplasmic n=1 Tax=Saccharomyces cerevisiae TaxID=4932 RepID=UPI0000DE1945|nr:Chain A, Glutamyl-tRNA synthetase, cytoplasmic [Saccharomyces cerevisiae]2HRA_B Chain B, Glutamyl-tRNA synthetase, cytoplasmic [Saccharomyces cerevisiae]